MLAIVWVDNLAKYLFVKELPVTNSILIFVYFSKLWLALTDNFKGKVSQFPWTMDKATKTAFLFMVVKFFFVPIMLNTVTGNWAGITNDVTNFRNGNLQVNFDNVYYVILSSIFLLDTGIFAFGYLFEARWLHNKIRSVEPSLLGWVVALSTYPSFNNLTSQIIPLMKDSTGFLATNPTTLHIVQICVLLCDLGFVLCSISLGTKASNLTNRGIVSDKMYKYIRHPAYFVKLLSWLFEGLIYSANFVPYLVAWLGWCFIYFMRAWTEERHLGMDPDYVQYKKKVKWMFIPGVL